MRTKFWKKPGYFDFSSHRRKPTVILHEFFSTITAAVTAVYTFLTGPTVIGISIGDTVYGISAATIGSILVSAAGIGISMTVSSLTSKSGKQGNLSTGGLLLYRRKV
jgi:hypothetical protein